MWSLTRCKFGLGVNEDSGVMEGAGKKKLMMHDGHDSRLLSS